MIKYWLRALRRRSQKDRFTWQRIKRLANDFLPQPRTLHPWPRALPTAILDTRFLAPTHARLRPARAEAVMDGALAPPQAHPRRLRARRHTCCGRDDDIRGEPACGGRTSSTCLYAVTKALGAGTTDQALVSGPAGDGWLHEVKFDGYRCARHDLQPTTSLSVSLLLCGLCCLRRDLVLGIHRRGL